MGVFIDPSSVGSDYQLSEAGLQELQEHYLYDYLARNHSQEEIQQFCESTEARSLVEAGRMSKRTIVRLSKQDDLARRKRMASYQLAKDSNDSLWDQLVRNRVKEKELIGKIETKYGNKAERLAALGQKDYLKGHNPLAFMRPDGYTMK